jgi:hypothetical protein
VTSLLFKLNEVEVSGCKNWLPASLNRPVALPLSALERIQEQVLAEIGYQRETCTNRRQARSYSRSAVDHRRKDSVYLMMNLAQRFVVFTSGVQPQK